MGRGSVRIDGVRLRRLRENAGLLLKELADRAGISDSHLSKIEVGDGGCSPHVAATLAAALRVTVEQLREVS